MATVQAAYNPPSGQNVVTLSGSVQNDPQFTTQPVAGDQVVYPDGLTVDAQLNVSGPGGAYTLYHIIATSGSTVNEAYSIPDNATRVASFTAGASYTTVTLEAGFETYAFEGWPANEPNTGWQLTTLTADGYFDAQGNYYSDVEHVHDVWVTDLAGTVYHQTLDNTGLDANHPGVPAIVSVGVPADGTYTPGQTLALSGNFDEVVLVAGGTPRLVLDLNGATRYANYVSGSDSMSLAFEYTVQAGDYAPNGIAVTALELNGATIRDVDDNGANLTLNGVEDASGVLAGGPPNQAVSIDGQSISSTSASITVSYPGANFTGYEYDLGSGWVASGSPIQLTGLTPDTPYTLDVRAINEFGAGSPSQTQFTTQSSVDTTPDPFTFIDQSDVARNDWIISNVITILGVDPGQDVPVTVTNGEYRVSTDGGATWGGWTSANTNVRLNYQVQVRHQSPGTYATVTATTLDAGGTQDIFESTTLADTVNPVIQLTGGNVQVEQHAAWVEPGFTATDNADGDITHLVTVGTVDTSVLGDQTLTYSVTDAAGNTGTATRTVTVVADLPDDTTAPVISLVGGNQTLTVGDPWVEPGYSATDDTDGDLTGSVVITGSVDVNTVGQYELTYSATDAAGNTGTAKRIVYVEAAGELGNLAPASRTFVCTHDLRIESGDGQYVKQPGERLDYDFDLTDWLTEQGDTLAETGHSAEVIGDSLTIDEQGVLTGTSRYKVWLSGGEPSVGYPVRLTALTTGGRTVIFQFRVVVIRRY